MEFFQEWRAADRAATAAEKLVYAASLREINQQGPGAFNEEIAHAHHLRRIANDLFAVAMQEIGEISKSLHH